MSRVMLIESLFLGIVHFPSLSLENKSSIHAEVQYGWETRKQTYFGENVVSLLLRKARVLPPK